MPADKGTVQKVIVLPRDDLLTEELVLEEVEVFKVKRWNTTSLAVSSRLCCNDLNLTVMCIWIPCPGPDSDYNDEDLFQKSKIFFLDFAHMTRENRKKKRQQVARFEKRPEA